MHFSGEFRESHNYKTISSREMCVIRANEAAHFVNGQKEQFLSAVSGQVAEIKSVCLHICFPSAVMLTDASVYVLGPCFLRFFHVHLYLSSTPTDCLVYKPLK